MIAERRLPRGRHGIAPEVVIANQRQRLLAATASLIAERGYCALHVADITERAGVSRRTFYRLYKDKRDCVLATQQHSIDSLSGRILAPTQPRASGHLELRWRSPRCSTSPPKISIRPVWPWRLPAPTSSLS